MKRSALPLTLLLALAASSAAACRVTPDTAIRVEVDSEVSSSAIRRVRMRTYDASIPAGPTIDEHVFTISDGSTSIPFSITVAPHDAARPSQHVGIDAVAELTSGVFVTARLQTAFVAGHILVAHMVLRDACSICSGDETCAASGNCVSAVVDPTTLPEYGEDVAMVDAGMDATVDTGIDVQPDVQPDVRPDVPPDMPPPPNPCLPDGGMTGPCPPNAMCLGPMGHQQCCFPMGGVTSCVGLTCPAGLPYCGIDPRGNASCCAISTP